MDEQIMAEHTPRRDGAGEVRLDQRWADQLVRGAFIRGDDPETAVEHRMPGRGRFVAEQ
ncbi:hypothetical protein ACWDYH_32015 [Nocardia goodfellowii]